MATTAALDGKSLVIKVHNTSTTATITNLTSNDLDMVMEARKTTTKDSGVFHEYQPTFGDLKFGFEGLRSNTASATGSEDIKGWMVAKTEIYWEWGTGVTGTEKISGRGFFLSYKESAPNGDNVTFSGSIQNNGEPTFGTYA
jgi:hypothetical protein